MSFTASSIPGYRNRDRSRKTVLALQENESRAREREAQIARTRHALTSGAEAHLRASTRTIPEDPPEVVRERLRRGRVVPVALLVACPTCGAPSGASCGQVTRGACGARIRESRT